MRPALEREHRVIAVDLLGFGGSEKPDVRLLDRGTRRTSSPRRWRGSACATRPSSATRSAARWSTALAERSPRAGRTAGDRRPGARQRRLRGRPRPHRRSSTFVPGDRPGALAGHARLRDRGRPRRGVRARLRRARRVRRRLQADDLHAPTTSRRRRGRLHRRKSPLDRADRRRPGCRCWRSSAPKTRSTTRQGARRLREGARAPRRPGRRVPATRRTSRSRRRPRALVLGFAPQRRPEPPSPGTRCKNAVQNKKPVRPRP